MTLAISLILIIAFILLLLGIPIFAVVGLVGFALSFFTPVPIIDMLALTSWAQSHNYVLISVPLFVLFGEILMRSGIAMQMYDAIAPWLNRMPGRLMQTNVATAALFAASSGSSIATTATITSVAIPLIEKYRYNEKIFLGSIAAGGTLGILIPPSVNLIVYGSITNTSIPELYLAALVPGLLLMALFMLTSAIICIVHPEWGGIEAPANWQVRFQGLPKLLPPIVVFLSVVGSIYAGIATPTEAASLGVLAALLMAVAMQRFSFAMLVASMLATARTTGMLMLIIIAAGFLNFGLGFMGFSDYLRNSAVELELPPYLVMLSILILYIILGMFLEGLSITVLTVPVLAPIIVLLGYDPVWFGIFVVVATEVGMITPPVGMGCFVIQGIRNRGSLADVFIGVTPYLAALLLFLIVIVFIPQIVVWYR